MKKLKSHQIKDNPLQKINEPSPLLEIKKKLISNPKTYKKEKTLTTKTNTTMIESSKEDKKEKKESIQKKFSKDSNKIKKSILTLSMQEKKLNKTIDIDHLPTKKKKIKKHRNSTKVKNSLSQKHFKSLRSSTSTKINLVKNKKLTNPYLLGENRNESSNNIMLGSDDNFVKSLLSKYMDGTDNIINEDSEAFNNIKTNADYDNISIFEEENENTETNTLMETIDMKKDNTTRDNSNSTNNINKINNNKTSNLKYKKKENKLSLKITDSENTKKKSNLSNSFINSPCRTREERLSIDSSNKQNKKIKNNKKINSNLQNKIKSFTKTIQNEGEDEKRSNSNKKQKDKFKRKLLYSSKLINSMNKLKQNNKLKTEVDYSCKKDLIPVITLNSNLDIILESNKISTKVMHHYLENTVSAKNKIVQKKQIASLEQNKNTIKLFQKPEINVNFSYNENTISNSNTNNKNLRMNKTPKIKKQLKERFSINLNNKNNYNNTFNEKINQIKGNGKKFSHHIKCEFSLDNNISGKNTINSKIFQKKIDDYLITRELGKGSYAVVKLAMDKKSKNKYAIKIYSKTCLIDPQLRNTVKNEINILKQIDNENVMKLYEVIDTQSNLYLVLEYINGINLLEIIKNEKNHFIKESRAKKIFLKVVQGINYCHQINIYHRDIKLENILVLKDDSIKIIDFGFGIICRADTYQKLFCGTKSYMPPEIVNKEKYIASYSDIWSLGVLFYAMLFGVFPFKGKDEEELFDKIKEAKISFPEYNPISDKIKELFGKIFVVNPSERIPLDEMINYLKDED